MATTTPNYGWDVPTSTDYVKDGATAIETLGDDIDASLFSITGGKNVGLVHINTTTISGAASTTISNVFTSAYANYVIEWNGATSAGGGSQYIYFNLASGGSAAATTNWSDMLLLTNDALGPTRSYTSGSAARISYTGDNTSAFTAQIKNPQATAKTVCTFLSYERSSSDAGITHGGALFNATTSYDGCVITTSGGGSFDRNYPHLWIKELIMSETLKAVIVDASTGEVIERDFTDEEIVKHEAQMALEDSAKSAQDAKAAARESALAKLADLGLTAEEIAAL